MEVKLQKWGNSNGIRIPSDFLKILNVKTNDKLDLSIEGEKIIISKLKSNELYLKEEFEKYNGKNLAKDFIWDEPKGREIW